MSEKIAPEAQIKVAIGVSEPHSQLHNEEPPAQRVSSLQKFSLTGLCTKAENSILKFLFKKGGYYRKQDLEWQ